MSLCIGLVPYSSPPVESVFDVLDIMTGKVNHATKRYRAEEIIHKLREAEVAFDHGMSTAEACKKLGIVEKTRYRWRREYGGLNIE